ncbi:MAG: RdgB/HAM1 family non-canonical purine NTP pyrophosphatase [Oscillospiraceae bacterium]|nr:RdgB/HAM1 family non-canonical purine NTP pyrophosphatase [Oscillospiraceae bacterium]
MRFVLASNNAHKLEEFREILAGSGWTVLSQKEAGIAVDPEENGSTFEENSLIKARAACAASGLPAIADDSGLTVSALNGEPGIRSARYGGPGLTDAGRYRLLLERMKDVEDRRAAFVCCISCVFPDGRELTARGECAGRILREPEGDGGFGYDPVFWCDDLGKSLGTALPEEKNGVSHRGRALRAMYALLNDHLRERNGGRAE